jgi:hypothetical protein
MTILKEYIEFRLVDLFVADFELRGQLPLTDAGLSVAAKLHWSVEPSRCVVVASLSLAYRSAEQSLLEMDVFCFFEIEEQVWNQIYLDGAKDVILPRAFLLQLGSITIGSARGLLHEKTANIGIAPFLLPILDVNRLVEDTANLRVRCDISGFL